MRPPRRPHTWHVYERRGVRVAGHESVVLTALEVGAVEAAALEKARQEAALIEQTLEESDATFDGPGPPGAVKRAQRFLL